MKVEKVSIEKAVGHILVHNQAGPDGRKALKKGKRLTAEDVGILQALGQHEVYVAMLTTGDIGENEAAHRLGLALDREGLRRSSATTGRVNLIADATGLFRVNVEALIALNELAGITLATIANNTLVQPKKIVGTIKIIPYAVPQERVDRAGAIIKDNNPLLEIRPFVVTQAALITTGSETARDKVVTGFTPALRDRLAAYETTMIEGPYVPEDEQGIIQALGWALDSGAQMIIIAGETSVMDANDITPRAIAAVGGEIVHYGVPVEPGNLLLLAYHEDIPIVGAPGCAKSKNYNVVDMVLPRLAAGERLTRRDLIELGHGGYLK